MFVDCRCSLMLLIVFAGNATVVCSDDASQVAAIAKLSSLGCEVEQDENSAGQRRLSIGFRRWKGVVRDFAFLSQIKEPTDIDVTGPLFADPTAQSMPAWWKIRIFSAGSTPISGKALTTIQKWESLESLDLSNTAIKDADLFSLRKLVKLKRLCLSDCKGINGSGIKHLRACSDLADLMLSGTSMDDDGLNNIQTLQSIRCLRLDGVNISDVGISRLAALGNLRVLMCSRTGISDEGVKSIAKLPNIQEIYANDTNITGKALEILSRVSSLKEVVIYRSRIDDRSVRLFVARRPDVRLLISE